ncbi:AAA family ATPase [Aeromonas veronii]|uniref:AAA family ATPase n=1 Tax=Aeromonas veronii TaxID=654 RepID=UPI0011173229|nr:AAA family ATPase [Aeromonas veronii]TNI45676.1 AAA family ATPase [Aeromonas veronii]
MTLLKPTFKISKLTVYQNGHIAFHCDFHDGLNIIRGRNSSGKTTIMDLLAYSIGAENIKWKPEALRCSHTLTEVELNGVKTCLRREVNEKSQNPIALYWGEYEKAVNAPFHEWDTFPFRRSTEKISFTQSLFGALDMPQAQGDGASNLTMHQLLRVLYADQPSVHSPIFRMDVFDSPLTREMVGGYLCGVYDDELYSSQLRLRVVESDLSKKITELKSIFFVLGKSGISSNIDSLDEHIKGLETEREETQEFLNRVKTERTLSKAESKTYNNADEQLRKKLNKVKSSLSENIEETEMLKLEVLDSKNFIDELNSRLNNLSESKNTREFFGKVEFQFCPCCLGELDTHNLTEGHCHLCNQETEKSNSDVHILRMKNELSIQANESRILNEKRLEKIKENTETQTRLKKELKQLTLSYNSTAKVWSTDIEMAIEDSSKKIGIIDGKIKQALELRSLASNISELQKKRDELTKEKDYLIDRIEVLEKTQEFRKKEISDLVSKIMIRLLSLDLPLQAEFIAAKDVDFSFVDNAVYVNGSKNFSESSAVILRHIFHLALLTASTKKDYMRVPRLLMLDGIDDGGMEKGRSHNLQKIIESECLSYNVDYQVIYATSEINPDFEASAYVVSRYFNPDNRSLDIRG